MIAIDHHDILKNGMTFGDIWSHTKDEFYEASWTEKFKVIMVSPIAYILVTLTNYNFNKFKNENLELYI